jgi:hypothetical protein
MNKYCMKKKITLKDGLRNLVFRVREEVVLNRLILKHHFV